MTNTQFTAVAWIALLAHIVIGVLTYRRMSSAQLIPLLNVGVALCVLGYCLTRWYGNVFRGIVWYWTDQVLPLYAILSLCAAVMALTGRMQITWPNTAVFAGNALVSAAAVVFVSTFRVNRLF